MRRARGGAIISTLLLLLVIPYVAAQTATSDDEPTARLRATMRSIFHALTTVFPLSLNAQQFKDSANRQLILQALHTLADNAAGLEAHGRDASRSFQFLRQALLRDAQEAVQHFEQDDFQEARFTVQQLTEDCFACHSRLPSPRQFHLGKRFLEAVRTESLAVKDRVRLAVATRQFDTALDIYEAMFRSTATPAGEIDLMGAFEDYLKIAVRVRDDFRRPIATLDAFRQRPDVPEYLRHHLVDWMDTLKALQHAASKGDALQRAGKLIRAGQQRNRFPADRRGLVHFVVASSLLHRDVASRPPDRVHLAEAYYLLGVAESHISRSFWIRETEFFLETAIRLAPMSAVAKKSYTFLEDYLITGYTGSAGLHLPPDVQTRLEALRKLIRGS